MGRDPAVRSNSGYRHYQRVVASLLESNRWTARRRERGAFVYFSLEPGQGPSPGWITRLEKPTVVFWSRYPLRWELGRHGVCLPLWLLFLLATVPTGALWWSDRRRRPDGHCTRCGYNLTGNISGVCPECGTAHRRNESASGTT